MIESIAVPVTIQGGRMRHKVDRYQVTFVMGSGDKGAAMDKLLADQTKRIGKLLNKEKSSEQAVLRVALRTLAGLKDKDVILDSEQ